MNEEKEEQPAEQPDEQPEEQDRPWMTVSQCGICEELYPVGALPYLIKMIDANAPGKEVAGFCCEACWRILLVRAGWTEEFGYQH